jgi:potassium-transporting ATPase KdpC subunit
VGGGHDFSRAVRPKEEQNLYEKKSHHINPHDHRHDHPARDKANGQLISKNGQVIGSRIIGQGFTGPAYFHSRLSSAGSGYDAANSNGSQLGPTNHALIDRVKSDVATNQADHPGQLVPIDLVTSSASGLDPDITPAAAAFQIARVAAQRGAPEDEIRKMVRQHTEQRQFGFLGEPRVNVLELNLDLDAKFPKK